MTPFNCYLCLYQNNLFSLEHRVSNALGIIFRHLSCLVGSSSNTSLMMKDSDASLINNHR